jgi:hypothetical protein
MGAPPNGYPAQGHTDYDHSRSRRPALFDPKQADLLATAALADASAKRDPRAWPDTGACTSSAVGGEEAGVKRAIPTAWRLAYGLGLSTANERASPLPKHTIKSLRLQGLFPNTGAQ